MLPGVADTTETISTVVRQVRVRDRDWVLLRMQSVRGDAPVRHALHDGERSVLISALLPIPDGAIYDILSNPLPDGREEVILAGDFLTLGGIASARIGRVILPAVGDVNADGVVDGRDVAAVVRALGSDDAGADLDMDGDVDRDDLRIAIDAVRRSKGANLR